ncbi:hypothetical protein U1Q18_047262 [Sarracenia purpurea var. burkii]
MAAEEFNRPPSYLHPPPPTTSLPLYPDMIMAAIEGLNDQNGSNKSAISKHIEATYGELPAAHMTLLSHHLNKMKQSGQLIMVKNNYMKPDPNAPPRRGRGRPPKPKDHLSPNAAISSPRPRGRPPKPREAFDPLSTPRDHLGPPTTPKSKPPVSGSGRPRGRPPKKAKLEAPPIATTAALAATTSGSPRGRGRPPKVKPQVAAASVEC